MKIDPLMDEQIFRPTLPFTSSKVLLRHLELFGNPEQFAEASAVYHSKGMPESYFCKIFHPETLFRDVSDGLVDPLKTIINQYKLDSPEYQRSMLLSESVIYTPLMQFLFELTNEQDEQYERFFHGAFYDFREERMKGISNLRYSYFLDKKIETICSHLFDGGHGSSPFNEDQIHNSLMDRLQSVMVSYAINPENKTHSRWFKHMNDLEFIIGYKE